MFQSSIVVKTYKPDVVVIKSLFLIPEPIIFSSNAVNGVTERDEVIEEFRSHLFIGLRVDGSQFQGDV